MIATTRILLNQLADVLDRVSPQDYTRSLDILHGASIGEHVRHTLEFYLCLIAQSADGCINYDLRKRDNKLESIPDSALETIHFIVSQLGKGVLNYPLILEFSYDPNGSDQQSIETNFYRELNYVIEHTVHHMALLKIGLHSLDAPVDLPESFGVAVSTLRYRKSMQQE